MQRSPNNTKARVLVARIGARERWGFLVALGFLSLLCVVLGFAASLLLTVILGNLMLGLEFFEGILVLIAFAILILLPQFLTGRLHSAVLVNSRTIAIKYRRGPIRILKRRDCVACGANGRFLWFADGHRYPIDITGAYRYDHDAQFLTPFYAWWWPGTTLEQIALCQAPHWKRMFFAFYLPGVTLILVVPLLFFLVGADTPYVVLSLVAAGFAARLLMAYADSHFERTFYCDLPLRPSLTYVPG